MIDLIFCSDGNSRLAEIAINNGFHYGAQLPNTIYFPPYFADQDWKNPNKEQYIKAIEMHKPQMATVLDWETAEQADEVFDWANKIADHVEKILIIPKLSGVIKEIPNKIGGKDVVLGYSVPTRFGSTSVEIKEFLGRPVHLLGGSPHAQLKIWLRLKKEIVSLDGNYAAKMAIKFNKFWVPGNAKATSNRWWHRLDVAEGKKWMEDAPYEAFRRSCINISQMWSQVQGDQDVAHRMLSKFGKENQIWLPMQITESNSF